MLWSAQGKPETARMWLFIQLAWMALMPLAHRMARTRGRSTRSWLEATLVLGPLAILALLFLGKRNREALRTVS